MHTGTPTAAARVCVLAVQVVGAAFACAALTCALLATPGPALAETRAADGVFVLAAPGIPDGPLGWNRTPVVLRLVPLAPGTVYYAWDDAFGSWHRADGPIIAPEGKHILLTRLVSFSGQPSSITRTPVRVDYRLPVAAPSIAAQASGGGAVLVRVRVNPTAGARIIRIGGADRHETAAMVSARNFEKADTVILATGVVFADALSASGLAGCVEGPVLLTHPRRLTKVTAEEIHRLQTRRVIIVGSEGAVSRAVATEVGKLGVRVERIGGKDRYETATMIASRVLRYGRSGRRVLIARGDDFADALALGPLAYAGKMPLILVQPSTVPLVTRSFLSANDFSSGCIAGGTVAVSPYVYRELSRHVGGLTRLWGDTRYSTAVAVASWGVANGLVRYVTLGVATGTDFADALSGGVAAGMNGGVILLTTPSGLHKATETAIGGIVRDVRNIQVYGGEAAIRPEVVNSIRALTR